MQNMSGRCGALACAVMVMSLGGCDTGQKIAASLSPAAPTPPSAVSTFACTFALQPEKMRAVERTFVALDQNRDHLLGGDELMETKEKILKGLMKDLNYWHIEKTATTENYTDRYEKWGQYEKIPYTLTMVMCLYDADGDGVFDAKEGLSKAKKEFQQIDADGDGSISLDDVTAHVSALGAWQPKDYDKQK